MTFFKRIVPANFVPAAAVAFAAKKSDFFRENRLDFYILIKNKKLYIFYFLRYKKSYSTQKK